MSVAPRRRMIRLAEFYKGNCAKSTAFKWINEGKLRAYKLGSMTFVAETFDEFVERLAAEREAAQRKISRMNKSAAKSSGESVPMQQGAPDTHDHGPSR